MLVKVVDRVLARLDELVRPYVHKILVVIEPLLIDEDYYARVEGREIVANLAKAAGLATMIAAMRPDIDDVDEYVRNTTARAFAVVASALGVPALLPFLKAVCRSKKSWQARHTGIKIVQQIAILSGLRRPAAPGALGGHRRARPDGRGGQGQDPRPWRPPPWPRRPRPTASRPSTTCWSRCGRACRLQRGKPLAAFLKAIGFIIPLMDADVRQLLHAGGHAHPAARVWVAGRGDEEDRPEGRAPVRRDRRRRARLCPVRAAARLFPVLLGAPHGPGPPQLPGPGRDDRRPGGPGGLCGGGRAHRGRPEGRGGAVPAHGHGDGGPGGDLTGLGRHRRPPGGAAGGRPALCGAGAVAGGDAGRGESGPGRLRHRPGLPGRAGQALPAPGGGHGQVAPEQQGGQGAPAGRRPGRPGRARHGGLRRRQAAGPLGGRPVRVPGRGVSGRAGVGSGGPGRHRGRHRHGPVRAAHPGPAAPADAHPEEPAREGAGALHRPGGAHRGPRARPGARARVDAHLLRAAGDAEGAQAGHPAGDGRPPLATSPRPSGPRTCWSRS